MCGRHPGFEFLTFFCIIQEDNFIHADMHPGNILVRVDESKLSRRRFFRPKPHIVFLDVGMTAELTRGDRDNLQQFFKAVATRDGLTAANCTLKLSKNQSCPDPVAFTEVNFRTILQENNKHLELICTLIFLTSYTVS
jgi:aarF domain-containing kinase